MGLFRNRQQKRQHEAAPAYASPYGQSHTAPQFHPRTTNTTCRSPPPPSSTSLAPVRKTALTREPVTTPPGHNKRLRDTARWLLAGYAACMLQGEPRGALVCSVLAVFTIYDGTAQSIKNLLWGLVVWTSLPTALFAAFLFTVVQGLQDKRGGCGDVCTFFWVLERGTEVCFGFVCGLVLALTAWGKIQQEKGNRPTW